MPVVFLCAVCAEAEVGCTGLQGLYWVAFWLQDKLISSNLLYCSVFLPPWGQATMSVKATLKQRKGIYVPSSCVPFLCHLCAEQVVFMYLRSWLFAMASTLSLTNAGKNQTARKQWKCSHSLRVGWFGRRRALNNKG